MLLWLDDSRPAPEGWTHCKTVNSAIELLKTRTVEYASLDYSMGYMVTDGGSGLTLVRWMAEHQCWPAEGIRVHSDHPIGVREMLAVTDEFSPYPIPDHWDSARSYDESFTWPVSRF